MSSPRPARRSTLRSTTRAMRLASACRKTRRSRQAAPTLPTTTRCWLGRAGRSICGVVCGGSRKRRRPICLATEEARRGVILSLVASVGSSYLQLRGLDEQLTISKAHARHLRRVAEVFELKFKYGQISQMNVEQVKVQYQTAAAQIPLIKISRSPSSRTRISILLGTQPGPDSARQEPAASSRCPKCPPDCPPVARAPARSAAGRAAADRRQRSDRRCQGSVLPHHLAYRRVRRGELAAQQPVQGPCAGVELWRLDHRPDLHGRRDFGPGRASHSRAEGRAAVLRAGDPERFRRRGKRVGVAPSSWRSRSSRRRRWCKR